MIRIVSNIAWIGIGQGRWLPIGERWIFNPAKYFFLIRRGSAVLRIPHAAIGIVIGIVGVIHIGQAIVGPRGRVPMFNDGRLIVAHAFGGYPFGG